MNPPAHPSEPFPPPTLTRCARHRWGILVQPDGVTCEVRVLQVGTRCYEMGRVIRGSIYGEVVHGLLLEQRPENNGVYSRTDTQCAIKYSEKRKLQRGSLENPLGELSAMQLITENNLSMATLMDAAEDRDYIYSVMRFCPGAELWEWVNEGEDFEQFDEDFARNVFRQIIYQMCELHSLGWAHKDMSLENVMYDPDTGTATIIDFGMTVRHHMFAPATAAYPVNTFCPTMPGEPRCGKRLYYPPEMQTAPLPSLDFRRNDMWACGIMLFWLVTGSPPMEMSTSADQRYNLIAVQGNLTGLLTSWGWAAHLSAEVVGLIQSLLRVDPLQRPTAAQVWQHSWLQAGGAVGRDAGIGAHEAVAILDPQEVQQQQQQAFPPTTPPS